MKNKLIMLAITGALGTSMAVQAESKTALVCARGYQAEATLSIGKFPNEPDEGSVELAFTGDSLPEMETRVEALKDCLAAASKVYKGKKNIYGHATYKGMDDVEIAESYSIYYDVQSGAVRVEEVELP